MENSEYGENGEDTRVLDWFRLLESKTLRQYVVKLGVNGEVP
jgi:hypothetical protein